jgi:hypothetical protein
MTGLAFIELILKNMNTKAANLEHPTTVDEALIASQMTMRLEYGFVQVVHALHNNHMHIPKC